MRALAILRQRLSTDLEGMHKHRQNALWRAVEALLCGGRLWLAALGRVLQNETSDKHSIKAIDRLLGNGLLFAELGLIYHAIASFLLRKCWTPVVLVDITEVGPSHWALTASLAYDGRALPLYAMVRSQKYIEQSRTHLKFLRRLKTVLPHGVTPIIVTDAGFRRPWLDEIERLGWFHVGRVRHRTQFWDGDQWITCGELYQRATGHARNLSLAYPKARPKQRRLVLSKRMKLKGRKRLTSLGKPSNGHHDRKHAKSVREPWLLVTNLTCNAEQVVTIYGYRMQIEETYRDEKNHRWGFSLKQTRSRAYERIEILLALAALATIALYAVGTAGEQLSLQYQFQANTTRSRRVLSLFVLGRFLLKPKNCRLLTAEHVRAGYEAIVLRIQNISAGASS